MTVYMGINTMKEENRRMSLQVEKLEKSMAKLTIEVSAEEFEKAVDTVYKRQRNRILPPRSMWYRSRAESPLSLRRWLP